MKEIWKDVSGFVGIYKISNLGRVLAAGKHWKKVNEQVNKGEFEIQTLE